MRICSAVQKTERALRVFPVAVRLFMACEQPTVYSLLYWKPRRLFWQKDAKRRRRVSRQGTSKRARDPRCQIISPMSPVEAETEKAIARAPFKDRSQRFEARNAMGISLRSIV